VILAFDKGPPLFGDRRHPGRVRVGIMKVCREGGAASLRHQSIEVPVAAVSLWEHSDKSVGTRPSHWGSSGPWNQGIRNGSSLGGKRIPAIAVTDGALTAVLYPGPAAVPLLGLLGANATVE
jgi:hypothetical protein